ncbi:LNS2-domain-containing protein [Fomitiporia mediterranea MF3/22]|uniref:LNS2-domain-containing protein n=1 Tax=Fomitiporia mediterranea (strain MF3/22) TaxID=694068 RepID=UPI00044099EF|nr:LNS2-domain-containing protein [Fomitiporia mediterranea MF3/22]EJD01525.1 LNS2-domain-containing protein [Fomitiporia mediterranea MF3/22]
MNYLRGALSAASQYYRDINPSTLTGAIDVIVVRREVPSQDGVEGNTTEELVCSPFHVRFGKWQVLRPVDKKVKVMVNGHEIPFNMKIGDAGEAFFVFETDDDVPEDLITSPILEATRPGQSNVHVEAGRFGAKEEGGQGKEVQPSESEKELGEPEPLDLDSPSPSAAKSTRPSGLTLSRPPATPESPSPSPNGPKPEDEHGTSDDENSLTPSRLIGKTAGLGKAVVKAAVEAERDERQRMHDRADAARYAASHAYESLNNLREGTGIPGFGDSDKGDEALPPVKKGEGEPPEVVYSDGMVLDAAGYHSKSEPPSPGTRQRPSRHSSPSTAEETDDYDSYGGRSTPRSGDPSTQATPTQSPDTSRSPSPCGRRHSITKHDGDRRTNLPAFRASSEPPDADRTSEGSPPPAYSWEWGAFPTPSPMKSTFSPALLESLETQRSVSVPPELSLEMDATHPPSPIRAKTTDISSVSGYASLPDEPTFYGEGAELSADETNGRRFLLSIGGRTYDFELSISEELAAVGGRGSGDELLDARLFRDGQVSFRRFIKYPAVIQDRNLVIRWNDKYVTRQDGSVLMDCLVKWREAALAKPVNARALEEEEPLSSSDEQEIETGKAHAPQKKSSSSWVRWWRSSRADPQPQSSSADATPIAIRAGQSEKVDGKRPPFIPSNSAPPTSDGPSSAPIPFPTMGDSKRDVDVRSNDEIKPSKPKKRFAKTLRLTSDQLKQLELKPGMNSITFSLSASGAAACTASIFLWESTDSVVVSDIDGTITKSDALGHVFTMIGRDWTHIGVAKLYTDICRNGYKVMYLTSRAIGQADSTRYYLKGINQNNYQLPEGPVIMSPDRLMASFHREVIMKKPEVFKMACLRDIQRLFGEDKNPFYAGFGNRITDALSYRSVNIPSQRIFTIDSTGEVKMELLEVAGYKSSYIHLTDLVDQMFPPIHRKTAPEYTDYNFWKSPLQEFALPVLTPPPSSPALSARSDASMLTFTRLRNFSLRQSTSSIFQQPGTSPTRNSKDGDRGMREMNSLERLSNRHTRSTETLAENAWSERERGRGWGHSVEDREETSRERRARKRLSLDSMPGSLSGSQADFEFDEEEEDEQGYDGDENYDEHEGGDGQDKRRHYEIETEDPEEAAEEGFDDDLLATGEMESVPFL